MADTITTRKLIRKLQLCPNSPAGCERSNSKYARFKNKYSNRMGIEVVRARSRAGENGPPLSLFNSEKSYQYWIDNNHRLPKKVKETESLVLKRLRKKAKTEHTSKIFRDF